MPRQTVSLIAAGLLLATPLTVAAQDAPPFSLNDPAACIAEKISQGSSVADCVNEAQRACFDYEEGAPAGTACFRNAREAWADLISDRMDEVSAEAPPEIAAIAGIEIKFDLRRNLLECERLTELQLVREEKSDALVHSTARCEATAVGLAFAKLMVQSRTLDAQ